MPQPLKILFLGDVYGKPGRKVITERLPGLRRKLALDFVVANGENAAAGLGITPETAKELYDAGVDVITMGNHTWDKPEVEMLLKNDRRFLRPGNYPPGSDGEGFRVYHLTDGRRVAVTNVMCRLFMEHNLDCPFQYSRGLMKDHRPGHDYDALVVDVHGEATSEKMCLGHIWDGRASLVVGSHTHVPTADARILPGGTGYHTDAGMCGTYDSVIGVERDVAIARFEKKGKTKITPAEGEGTMCGTYIEVGEGARCTRIAPVLLGGSLAERLP